VGQFGQQLGDLTLLVGPYCQHLGQDRVGQRLGGQPVDLHVLGDHPHHPGADVLTIDPVLRYRR